MSSPRFSIIIPVYNVEPFIKRCINSVLKQDYTNWEIILVDDGSEDRSGYICDSYARMDKRITVLHQTNKGVSCARNTGLKLAKGDYICFIDADDYWDHNNLLSLINDRTNSDIVYLSQTTIEYPNGRRKVADRSKRFVKRCTEDVLGNIADKLINGWGCVFFFIKRRIICDNSITFSETTKIGEDVDWIFRVAKYARSFDTVKSPAYVYTVNRKGSAMTHKKYASVVSFFNMIKHWKMIASTNSEKKAYTVLCNNAVNYISCFSRYTAEEQTVLLNLLKESGAIDNSNSVRSNRIRKGLRVLGEKKYIFLSGIIYSIRQYGSRIKGFLNL